MRLTWVIAGVLLIASFVHAAESEYHTRLVKDYLETNPDALDKDLLETPKPDSLTAAEKADVALIKAAAAECRPAWWAQCKAKKKSAFAPVVWKRTLTATYDPTAKSSTQMNFNGTQYSFTVGWPADDMDNNAQAEHGYTKGELGDLGVWMTLGQADAWTIAGTDVITKPQDDKAKLVLVRYFDFRGMLTGTYYGLPRARRWGLFLSCHTFQQQYAKMETVMSRKAVAAAFVDDIILHPDKYPSIKLPKDLPADNAEEKLALDVQNWIEGHGWTLAEDDSIRANLLALAAANGKSALQTGVFTLPNGMMVAMDPAADAPLKAKRDAWTKAQFSKIAK